MNKFVYTVLICLLIPILSGFLSVEVKQDPVIKTNYKATTGRTLQESVDSIVYVLAGHSSGTGFYIAPNYIVTSQHVVTDKKTVNLSRRDLPTKSYVVDTNEDLDIAVIYTERPGLPVITYESYTNLIQPGDFLYSLGINGYEFETAKTGRVLDSLGDWPLGEFDAIISDTILEPGFSGGPTFDTSNNVIGVNTGIGWNGRKRYSYITPIEAVLPWIKKVIVKHKKKVD